MELNYFFTPQLRPSNNYILAPSRYSGNICLMEILSISKFAWESLTLLYSQLCLMYNTYPFNRHLQGTRFVPVMSLHEVAATCFRHIHSKFLVFFFWLVFNNSEKSRRVRGHSVFPMHMKTRKVQIHPAQHIPCLS